MYKYQGCTRGRIGSGHAFRGKAVVVHANTRITRSRPVTVKGSPKARKQLLGDGKSTDGTIVPYKRNVRDFDLCDESIINQAYAAPDELPLPSEALALVLLTSAVTFICSIDRAAMSVAILPMSEAFKWDDGVKGAVSAAFFAGYMITNVCGGFLATRFSAKGVLAAGVMLWSLFTIATPAAAASGSLPELLAVRSMMGVGEGVSYPSIQNLVRQAIPGHARSRALAFIYSGHQLGTVASYVTAPVLISQLGWQSVFFAFGSLGFVWLLSWTPFAQGSTQYKRRSIRSRLKAAYLLLRTRWRYRKQTSQVQKPLASQPLRFKDVPWRDFATAKAILGHRCCSSHCGNRVLSLFLMVANVLFSSVQCRCWPFSRILYSTFYCHHFSHQRCWLDCGFAD